MVAPTIEISNPPINTNLKITIPSGETVGLQQPIPSQSRTAGARYLVTIAHAVEHTDVDQQLRYETIERRKGADSHRCEHHKDSSNRHMLSKATHLIHRRSVHLRVDITSAHEQHGLDPQDRRL